MAKARRKSDGGKQGEFIKELASRPQGGRRAPRLTWEEPLVSKSKTDVVPDTKLGKIANAKDHPSPAPVADLPRTVDGNIDVAEVKQDLISQLKAQRKKG